MLLAPAPVTRRRARVHARVLQHHHGRASREAAVPSIAWGRATAAEPAIALRAPRASARVRSPTPPVSTPVAWRYSIRGSISDPRIDAGYQWQHARNLARPVTAAVLVVQVE